jgi:S-adenosylmethionine hydrolase
MTRSPITLTTDFGLGSGYVAEMKGAILSINPAAILVDLTHEIPPQQIAAAAYMLERVSRCFPAETIHVTVVDPGVGTERAIVCLRAREQYFIAPDNGLLTTIAEPTSGLEAVRIENRRYWRDLISATFHGRDIMGPVAAHLSLGVPMSDLGSPQPDITRIPLPTAVVTDARIEGEIIWLDTFGNAVTNVHLDLLPKPPCDSVRVGCGQLELAGIVRTYADATPGTLVALVGSSGRLEIAVVNGNAAERFDLRVGDPVVVMTPPTS